MHRPTRPETSAAPARRPLTRWGIALLALLVLIPAAATARPIEDYAPYQPQTNCSPNAKAGTVRLSRWLQQEYKSTGSMGISRSCKDGGVSEHKEGRAFDWAADVGSASDRAAVDHFFRRIFATDDEGNTHALARRMGIMYLIWNDRIYSAYYGFRAREYRGCKQLAGCSATRRHRNHVHISLSRAGGAGTTSWYTGGATVPGVPVLDLARQPYVGVNVPADGKTVVTPFKLRKGTSYKVTAAGLYGYGAPAQVADASCRWLGSTRTWTPYPSTKVAASHGSLNLLVDGVRFADNTCRPSHVYARTIRAKQTKALSLRLATKVAGSGGLTVLVSKVGTDVRAGLPTYAAPSPAPTRSEARSGAGLIAETVAVPAAEGAVWSGGSLEEGADYRLTVTGTVGLGTNNGSATGSDGRCVSVQDSWWTQASLDRRVPGADHGKLYVDGVPFTGAAPSGPTCASRIHSIDWTANRTGRLELALWDPLSRADNTGSLSVEVQRLTPVANPVPAAAERPATTTAWRQPADKVQVRATARNGAVSRMRLRSGQAVDLVVRGTQRSGPLQADATCVRTTRGWRSADTRVALRQDPLELWVDGRRVQWRPTGKKSGCASAHAYRTRFVAKKSGPVRLAVLDLDHRDNQGTLAVTMTRR